MSYVWALTATLTAIVAALVVRRWWTTVTVYPWQVALLYRDGMYQRTLEAGRHSLFDPFGRVRAEHVSITEQHSDFGLIDAVTSDQFAFRLQLSLIWTPRDARALYEAAGELRGVSIQPPGLRDQVAAATLAAVGELPLDEAVAKPAAIGDAVVARLGDIAHVEIGAALVTRLQFPPETRRMLTDAERARRDGLAALERARGEQAALRVLANAARLVRDNPELAQLRMLQSVEASKGPTTFIIGDSRTGAGAGVGVAG